MFHLIGKVVIRVGRVSFRKSFEREIEKIASRVVKWRILFAFLRHVAVSDVVVVVVVVVKLRRMGIKSTR